MENSGIIRFSDFFKGEVKTNSNLKKEDFNEFFLPEESITESLSNEELEEVQDELDQYPYNSNEDKWEEEESNESVENYYLVYKDKLEDFSCDVQLEGANLSDTEARLILESDDWTLMFNGDIDNRGKCTIPIKKLTILNEGLVGKIRLEIIAEGTVFTPWEDNFKVKLSKKVAVKIHESKSNPKKPEHKKSGVKVNVKR
jgi:6-pyruvoyl-tetrahydropterin synthase